MTSKTFGYIRVSSKEQNLDRQLESMLQEGINERDIYQEKQSGATFERPRYKALKDVLREGDTIVIKSLDRLGRNYEQIKQEWNDIVNIKKCNIKVLDMPVLDTTNNNKELVNKVITDIVLQLLGYVAEQERNFIKQRQREGIDSAIKKGVKFGRPKAVKPDNFDSVVARVKAGDITSVQAMRELNLTKTTYYKLLKS